LKRGCQTSKLRFSLEKKEKEKRKTQPRKRRERGKAKKLIVGPIFDGQFDQKAGVFSGWKYLSGDIGGKSRRSWFRRRGTGVRKGGRRKNNGIFPNSSQAFVETGYEASQS